MMKIIITKKSLEINKFNLTHTMKWKRIIILILMNIYSILSSKIQLIVLNYKMNRVFSLLLVFKEINLAIVKLMLSIVQ